MGTDSSIKGQVAIVTGAGRGIGAATAEALAAAGAKVFLCARTASEVSATVNRIGKSAEGMALDLAEPGAAKKVFDAAEKAFSGSVRILVNNAGVGYAVDLLGLSDEAVLSEWEKTQAVNVRAPFLLSREMMKRFQARKDREGCIVNIGSLGGIRSTEKFPGLSIYVASKFAVAGLTEALAVEGRPLGIRVNAVAPGAVDTEMLRKAAPHLKTETTPADVARVIVGLCDPAVSKAMSGAIIEIHSNL